MTKPLAILFADIAESTPLYERLGDARAAEITRRALFHLRAAIEIHGGTVVKTTGDGLLAAFPVPDDAAWAATTIQGSATVFSLRFRVGLHFGSVVKRPEDLYGDACNVAARVEALARPGETLATEDLIRELSPDLRARTKALHNVSLRGKSAPIRIHELRATATPDEAGEIETTQAYSAAMTADIGRQTLVLAYRGNEYALTPLLSRLTVGREETCGVRVVSPHTSRQHAVIDFSRDSFIVTDQSTNGTFVRTADSYPVALRRDSTKLVGSGLIGFGAEPLDETQDHFVTFRCERK